MIKLFQLLVFLLVIPHSLLFAQESNSGYLRVGNDSIFYETAGSGKVIVFIHDGLIHREVWDEQYAYFSKSYKVIRYDRRGYGKSSPATADYSNLDDLNFLFAQLNIDSACIIGASSGGRLAIDFALNHQRKVTSLVLVGAVVGGFSFTNHFYTRGGFLPSDLSDTQQRLLYYASYDPYEIYYENTNAKKKAIELVMSNPRKIDHRYDHSNRTQTAPSYLRLNEIKVPVLILTGEYDIPDVQAHAGVINAGVSNSKRIIIPKSGHLIPLEQPATFNMTVEDFLND